MVSRVRVTWVVDVNEPRTRAAPTFGTANAASGSAFTSTKVRAVLTAVPNVAVTDVWTEDIDEAIRCTLTASLFVKDTICQAMVWAALATVARTCRLVVEVRSTTTGSLLSKAVSEDAAVFDHNTNAWAREPTSVTATFTVVADWLTSPRWTDTPHWYSTTAHSTTMAAGVVSSVTRTNSTAVEDANRPRSWLATGRLLE